MAALEISDFDSIRLFTLKNRRGTVVKLSNYGATVTSVSVTDRKGKFADVVLGYDSLEGYLNALERPYFGATIGRVANRIAGAAFRLDGKVYRLVPNSGPHQIHGGRHGFDKIAWSAEGVRGEGFSGVRFNHVSKDGEEGFPGNLRVTVSYTLSEDHVLAFEAKAITDKPTPVNLTSHSYFNLAGEGQGTVFGHHLWINADHYTPVDRGMIPEGNFAPVAGSPFDFRVGKLIGRDIHAKHPQLRSAQGYDHNFALNKGSKGGMVLAATLYEPGSGRFMELSTQEPGLQVYSGNQLDGRLKGKAGLPYVRHGGLCLEPQHFPDSPNQPQFPSIILRPGKTYQTKTSMRFSTKPADFENNRKLMEDER